MKNLKRYVRQKEHPKDFMAKGYVLNESFFFLCEFLGKDFENGPCLRDEEQASNIIDGEKQQSNGVQVETSK